MLKIRLRFLAVALLGLTAAGCATSSTTFVTTWRPPDARPLQLSGRKVVALFISHNPTERRVAEDALAREITARGAEGVPAYSLLSDEEIKNEEAARQKLAGLGFSGVVAMRVVGQETDTHYEPVYWQRYPHYRRFWGGYWGYGWARVYDPGYLVSDTVVSVETLIYSFERDELVWAGISKTVNPSRVEGLVRELAAEVAGKMSKEGLLRT